MKNIFFYFLHGLSYGWRGRIAQGNRSCSKALPGEVHKINRAGAEIDDSTEKHIKNMGGVPQKSVIVGRG